MGRTWRFSRKRGRARPGASGARPERVPSNTSDGGQLSVLRVQIVANAPQPRDSCHTVAQLPQMSARSDLPRVLRFHETDIQEASSFRDATKWRARNP